jgi:hypothetical protein
MMGGGRQQEGAATWTLFLARPPGRGEGQPPLAARRKLRLPTPTLMLELTLTKMETTAAAAAVGHHLVVICKGGGGGVRLMTILTTAADDTARGGGARDNPRIVLTGRRMTTTRRSPRLPRSCCRLRRGIRQQGLGKGEGGRVMKTITTTKSTVHGVGAGGGNLRIASTGRRTMTSP